MLLVLVLVLVLAHPWCFGSLWFADSASRDRDSRWVEIGSDESFEAEAPVVLALFDVMFAVRPNLTFERWERIEAVRERVLDAMR